MTSSTDAATPISASLTAVHEVAHLMRKRFDRLARPHGLNRAQWTALSRIAKNPGASQAAIAEAAEVEPITLARIIDRLAAAGLVRREPDPNDRRAYRLALTDAAWPLLATMRAEAQAMWTAALEGVSREEEILLERTLARIKANLADLSADGLSAARRAEAPPAKRSAV